MGTQFILFVEISNLKFEGNCYRMCNQKRDSGLNDSIRDVRRARFF